METCSECGEDNPGTTECEECGKSTCLACTENHDCGPSLNFEEKINRTLGL